MVARLAYTNPNNTASSDTMTHISGLDFKSHQGNEGDSGNTRLAGEVNIPSAYVEYFGQEQASVLDLRREYNTHTTIINIIEEIPV